ncbi:hypothetical protein WR25_19579 [Diploscapter pachys]|uniref:Protein tweety homolog n=1 Tax=Diploscapter pachys TaxID=2018661 RepID=A0A2A2LCM8_9BILA|nr:hypothetical protein WR25_19579 [Diploscapter pachys]
MTEFINWVFSTVPHFNFQFKRIANEFDVDWRGEYAQSLALLAAVVALASLLLLLTVIITWVCQCCSKQEVTGKSRRQVRRLTTVLFALSVICFFLLGFCIFGNEQVNRGVTRSIEGLNDVNKGLALAVAQGRTLNDTCYSGTKHIDELENIVHRKSKEKGINQTLVEEIDTLLTNLETNLDSVISQLRTLEHTLSDSKFLENTKSWAERIEIERWLILVFILSIAICVLFAGVIAFCRQSNKGAVLFSGIGLVIFILMWILVCLIFPATVALSDFCNNGGKFIKTQLKEPILTAFEYYKTCEAKPTHDNVPPVFHANNMSDALSGLQNTKSKLDALMMTTFNNSAEIANASALISVDATNSLKTIGALESGLACYAYKDDILAIHHGICDQAIIGASIIVLCLFLLGIFLFTLLIIVSKSWRLFSRLPNDYIEVDEQDPFFPPGNDSMIPVDIYGTHVFNPRTRERTEPSTNTTSATNAQDEPSTSLWNRTSNPTAPNASIPRSPYGETGGYNNFQDRYEV